MALPRRTFTYVIPEDLEPLVFAGVRVEVQFGKKKVYSALVDSVHENAPEYPNVKEIRAILDEVRLITPEQFKLWNWISEYYCCPLGSVMQAALPSHLKLSSETQLVFNREYGEDFSDLDDDAYLIAEGLAIRGEITLEDARLILNRKTVFPVIQRLLTEGVLTIREDLQEKFSPKTVTAVRLAEPYHSDRKLLKEVMDDFRSERQLECLMAYLIFEKKQPYVLKQDIVDKAVVTDGVLNGIAKKGVLELFTKEVSRLGGYEEELSETPDLSEAQRKAFSEINTRFESKNTVLLHGVTGSGKTRIYIELMRKTLAEGKQVLYMLPEIALTTQIINRLKKVFGNDVLPYHSKINYNERVEVWKGAQEGQAIIIGARSSLFLPFSNLGLIIVDEEHDGSFKQYDPAPRYHARDAATVLAGFSKAKVLLGTATPSVESYHNALQGKYGLVELKERFGGLQMPEIELVDLKKAHQTKQMYGPFSDVLLNSLKIAKMDSEQAILFQNRRGYAPVLHCLDCGWIAECNHCDVALTFHKFTKKLHCHYCGFQRSSYKICPACNSGKVAMMGTGTQKIEEDLAVYVPDSRLGRMDLDTAGGKKKMATILNDFEEKRIDILIGTQMVTKGLDFDNVGLVGVISADKLLGMPDFRANERAFQLMVQVAGRAGRKHRKGRVQIQAYNLKHPLLDDVVNYNFENFIGRELHEREAFGYPPFMRLIAIQFQHKDRKIVERAAAQYAKAIRPIVGRRLLGPTTPNVSRVRSFYLQDMLLKIEKNNNTIRNIKQHLLHQEQLLLGQKDFSAVRVNFDVDPM